MKLTLFGIYGIFLSFVIGYAVFATMTFDGAIEHSYEKGLEYPIKLARLQELGWQFKIENENFQSGKADPLDLWILTKDKAPVSGATVAFEVIRPASLVNLPGKIAKEIEPGHYSSSITLPGYGHWLVKTLVLYKKERLEHEFRIYAGKG